MRIWLAGLVLLGMGAEVSAQEKKAQNEPEAMRCWWKTDRNAVQFGQPFNLILTCQAADSSDRQAVVEEGLGEGVGAKLAPFEVLAVLKYQDLSAGETRFTQYRYTLRLMTDGLWGRDLTIPGLEIGYRVRHTVAKTPFSPDRSEGKLEMIVGQPQVYLLPAYPMRIISLVPKEAKDIRDAGLENFGDRERATSQARLALGAAGVFAAGGMLMMMAIAFQWIRQLFRKESPGHDPLSKRALLRRLGRELGKIKKIRQRQVWTADLLIGAISVFRVAGAVFLSRPVTQAIAQVEDRGLEGQLKLRQGWLRPRKVLVSSSLTAEEMRKLIVRRDQLGGVLLEIAEVLEGLCLLRYGRDQQPDSQCHDLLLKRGQKALQRAKHYDFWPVRKWLSLREKTGTWWRRLWIRS